MNIGKGQGGKAFSIPADAVTQTFSIMGKRGVGKTHTAAVITEQLLDAGCAVVVIDPLDVWWGLRADRNGKPNGFGIAVLGGEHGDLPLHAKSGAAVADFVVERGASVVLSVRHFSMNEQRQFVTDFCERFYQRKGEPQYRQPVHLVIDEADEFAPQRIPHGHERMLGAVDRIVRRGRSSGIGVTLVTQRSAAIHKDVLSQTEMLVCHKTISPQDRAALEAWIEAHDVHEQRKAFMASLASLDRGVAWFWSPGWADCFAQVAVNPRRTFDSSATPKAGEKPKSAKLAPVDLDALKTAMAATVEEAEKNDPKKLKSEIARLTRELAANNGHVETRIEVVEVPVLPAVCLASLESSLRSLRAEVQGIANEITRGEKLIEDAKRVVTLRAPVTSKPTAKPAPHSAPRAASGPGDASLGNSGMRRMLVAIAQHPEGVTAKKVAALSIIARKGGTWRTYMGKLRTLGFVEGDDSCLTATDAGMKALGDFEPLPTGADLIPHWQSYLGNSGMRRIFDVLVEAYPKAMTADELHEAADIERGGTWRTYIGKLRTLELIERGQLKAAAELFEGE